MDEILTRLDRLEEWAEQMQAERERVALARRRLLRGALFVALLTGLCVTFAAALAGLMWFHRNGVLS